MYYKIAPIPPAKDRIFQGGIDHPDLWLWDSWTMPDLSGALHLYCLALSKTLANGTPITPPERNDFVFHVRHFVSADAGTSWHDHGAVMTAGQIADGSDARNVWSGSVLGLEDGRVAYGFTGIRDCGANRSFLQTICVATGSGPHDIDTRPATAISCPLRDYDEIVGKGFYLGPRNTLGSNTGEEGGPIMAWRDPFLFEDQAGDLHAVWSAKISPTVPAIAHARLKRNGRHISLVELSPPIQLPDADLMTQAEVPKIYRDPVSGDWLLMISACDRRYEGQSDSELTHFHRLYRSANIQGPWVSVQLEDSKLSGLEGLFGASLLQHDLSSGNLTVLGPFTENAGPEKQLQFAEPKTIKIDADAPVSAVKSA